MTHKKRLFPTVTFALAALLGFMAPLLAADKPAADPAKSAYPLTTCVVSDEKLEGGDMGGPVDYIHKEAGKPDRLVRFCCKDCIKDFKKEPEKYLKKLDEAEAAKKSGKPSAPPASSEHKH